MSIIFLRQNPQKYLIHDIRSKINENIILLLIIFVNTTFASPLVKEFKLNPAMDVAKHINDADVIVIGRFTGEMNRFIFDGYDEHGNPKTRLLTAPFNLLKEKFGFPVAN